MENVMNILAKKQSHFNKISPSSTISEAICRMSCQHADYLIVMDDDDHFLGLLTEHEIATQAVINHPSVGNTPVISVMNNRWPIADKDDTVEECMRLMSRYSVRYVPVFEDLHFLGIISTDDILKEAVSHRFGIFDDEVKSPRYAYSY